MSSKGKEEIPTFIEVSRSTYTKAIDQCNTTRNDEPFEGNTVLPVDSMRPTMTYQRKDVPNFFWIENDDRLNESIRAIGIRAIPTSCTLQGRQHHFLFVRSVLSCYTILCFKKEKKTSLKSRIPLSAKIFESKMHGVI